MNEQNDQDFLNVTIDMGVDENTQAWDGKSSPTLDLGDYDFEILEAAFREGKNGKAPQLELKNKVIGPAGSPMLDRTMKSWYPIQPTEEWARNRWAALLDACNLPRGKVTPAAFIGLRYRGEVSERTYTTSDGKGGTKEKTSRQISGDAPLAAAPAAQVAKPAVVRPAPRPAAVNGPAQPRR